MEKPSGFRDQVQYKDVFEGQTKKIECTHEIVFNITASVLTQNDQNDKDQDISCKEIMTRHYHIPVKDEVNYKEFMHTFFSFLENCLASSAQHAYKNTPNQENQK